MTTRSQAHSAALILGIETSCDDTACAVVRGDGTVISSSVSSQLDAHRPYGGVVPEIASREHLRNWPPVLHRALSEAGIGLDAIDAFAATRAPGLIGSLLVGLSLGKGLARGLDRPFYGVHHLEGHLYSPFLKTTLEAADLPPKSFVALVVSGGHSALYRVTEGEIETVAETRDDAMGEVFDKVGKRLGLLYPQGPRVDELAEAARGRARDFALARCTDGSLDFSFSGLKTETLRALGAALAGTDGSIEPSRVPGVAEILAGFRSAAVEQLLERLERLHRREGFGLLAVSGGVAANRLLRRNLPEWSAARGVDLRLVELAYSGDNAAMIAHAAARRLAGGDPGDSWKLEAESRERLGC
ncbi:MAG: tRNA (adenosine(37)-N6)-threonylcarbamoyltransferase complex transferase subunit TsaD [Thermoanaerobaculia bacterium]